MDSKKPTNIWISFDMEMNKDPDSEAVTDNFGKTTMADIIQLGACAFDFNTGKIVGTFKKYVKLPTGKALDPFITTLTGITQEDLDTKGTSLYLAYKELEFFVKEMDAFRDCVSWGGNDANYLLSQLRANCDFKEKFIFGSLYFDAKKFFQAYCQMNNLKLKSGMARSMRRLGLNFKGRIHDALDDSINCTTIFYFLVSKMNENVGLKKGQKLVLENKEYTLTSINQDNGEVTLINSDNGQLKVHESALARYLVSRKEVLGF